MNQILAVAPATSKKTKTKKTKEPRNHGPVAIQPIVRFFAICMIVFGGACISMGAYHFIQQRQLAIDNMSIPTLTTEVKKNAVILRVTHDKGLNKMVYNWNNGEDTIVYGRGQTAIQKEVVLPIGHNTLNITIIDSAGKEVQYQKSFDLTDEDVVEPEITIAQDGNATIKITAKDETAIQYMEYYWEGEEPIRIEATTSEQTMIEERIEVREGQNQLYIIAEDTNHNIGQTEKTIVGATKPKIVLNREGDTIIITATDEQGISKVEYTLNEVPYEVEGNGQKQVDVRQDLVEGNNTFIITVTNINTLIAQGKASCEK